MTKKLVESVSASELNFGPIWELLQRLDLEATPEIDASLKTAASIGHINYYVDDEEKALRERRK